jgi:hypothetical protein
MNTTYLSSAFFRKVFLVDLIQKKILGFLAPKDKFSLANTCSCIRAFIGNARGYLYSTLETRSAVLEMLSVKLIHPSELLRHEDKLALVSRLLVDGGEKTISGVCLTGGMISRYIQRGYFLDENALLNKVCDVDFLVESEQAGIALMNLLLRPPFNFFCTDATGPISGTWNFFVIKLSHTFVKGIDIICGSPKLPEGIRPVNYVSDKSFSAVQCFVMNFDISICSNIIFPNGDIWSPDWNDHIHGIARCLYNLKNLRSNSIPGYHSYNYISHILRIGKYRLKGYHVITGGNLLPNEIRMINDNNTLLLQSFRAIHMDPNVYAESIGERTFQSLQPVPAFVTASASASSPTVDVNRLLYTQSDKTAENVARNLGFDMGYTFYYNDENTDVDADIDEGMP